MTNKPPLGHTQARAANLPVLTVRGAIQQSSRPVAINSSCFFRRRATEQLVPSNEFQKSISFSDGWVLDFNSFTEIISNTIS